MAIVNPGLGPIILAPPAGKDSRWLTLEVCREFARSKCSRSDEECKYAHPPPHVEIQNGRVTCCFDSIKGKCQRKDPPCKYLHPPQHLKEILLQNGRQNLILKNLQMQATLQPMVQMQNIYPVMYEPSVLKSVIQAPSYSNMIVPGQYLTMMPSALNTHPYLVQSPGYSYYNPPSIGNFSTILPSFDTGSCTIPVTVASNQMVSSFPNGSASAAASSVSQQMTEPQNVAKQVESSTVSCSSPSYANQHNQQVVSWDASTSSPLSSSIIALDSTNTPYCQPLYYKGMNGLSGMVPVMKRPALVDVKSGLPVYRQIPSYPQSATLAAMQLQSQMQLHQHQFVPITIAGTMPVIPRIN